MALRTPKQVINGLIRCARHTNYIGIACEPISTHLDPDNEIEGDFLFTVQYERESEEGLFVAPFQYSLVMGKFLHMDLARFKRNMVAMEGQLKDFEQRLKTEKHDSATIIHKAGVSVVTTDLAKAQNRAKKKAASSSTSKKFHDGETKH